VLVPCHLPVASFIQAAVRTSDNLPPGSSPAPRWRLTHTYGAGGRFSRSLKLTFVVVVEYPHNRHVDRNMRPRARPLYAALFLLALALSPHGLAPVAAARDAPQGADGDADAPAPAPAGSSRSATSTATATAPAPSSSPTSSTSVKTSTTTATNDGDDTPSKEAKASASTTSTSAAGANAMESTNGSASNASAAPELTGCAACCAGQECDTAFRGTPGKCCGEAVGKPFCCPSEPSPFGEAVCYRSSDGYRCRAEKKKDGGGGGSVSPWWALFSLLLPIVCLAMCCYACLKKPKTSSYNAGGPPQQQPVYGYPQQQTAGGYPPQHQPGGYYPQQPQQQQRPSGGGYGMSNLAGAGAVSATPPHMQTHSPPSAPPMPPPAPPPPSYLPRV